MFVQLRAVLWVDLPVCCILQLTWGANWTNLKQSSQAACLGMSRSGCVGAGVLWSSWKCLHILACHGVAVLEQVFSGHLGSACTSWCVTEWLCWSRCSLVIWKVPQGHMPTVPSLILLKRWALIALFVVRTGDLVNSAEVVGSTATRLT